jgi:hypothetical protein
LRYFLVKKSKQKTHNLLLLFSHKNIYFASSKIVALQKRSKTNKPLCFPQQKLQKTHKIAKMQKNPQKKTQKTTKLFKTSKTTNFS